MYTKEKKRKKELTCDIHIRVSEFEKNRIEWLAKQYAGGNVSLYMIFHAIHAKRKEIKIDDLKEYSKRRKKPSQQDREGI